MRIVAVAVVAALLLAAAPARAQLSNWSIAAESAASTAIGHAGTPRIPVILAATRWLEGDVDATFQLAFGSAPAPGGRAADGVRASLGLRWSLLPDPMRPQLSADLGLRRAWDGSALQASLAAAAAIELFVARDVALAARVAARVPLGAGLVEVELTAGAATYF